MASAKHHPGSRSAAAYPHPRGADAYLSPAAIRILRETFEREAEVLVERLVERREFDGVAISPKPIR